MRFQKRFMPLLLALVLALGTLPVQVAALTRGEAAQALLSAAPQPDPDVVVHRVALEGEVPNPANPPSGCHFHPRCARRTDRCAREAPPLVENNGHWVACWNCGACNSSGSAVE